MRQHHSVPCSTLEAHATCRTSDLLVSRTQLLHRTLRRGLLALAIPATLIVGNAWPAAPLAGDDVARRITITLASASVNATVTPIASASGDVALGALRAVVSYDAAELARQFIGAPYRYGGASPRGFDCSGLTSYVYRQLGVQLPRTARAQWAYGQGERITSIAELQPGDLVYFERTTRARGVTHAAIYVGDGMMVSANSPRTGVQLVSINTAYWRTRFVGGLRPLREVPDEIVAASAQPPADAAASGAAAQQPADATTDDDTPDEPADQEASDEAVSASGEAHG
ncbi:C40 family peptidase [Kallotenue papyrolyticum]|uniref:C40 family peptidase n=1 Tax=Kallotenue papyrolyticum TaxID=1325125 RepID=UPI0004786167|nr:C40 family peptidase [Kallotenue papyrolyticum]